MSSNSFKNEVTYKLFPYKSYIYIINKYILDIYIYLIHGRRWNLLNCLMIVVMQKTT